MWQSQPGMIFSRLHCPSDSYSSQGDDHEFDFLQSQKTDGFFSSGSLRRGAGALIATRAEAKSHDSGVRKLNRDAKPADGKQMITPLIIHNGLIYISGQGANSNGPVGKDDIDSHVTKVLDNVKELVCKWRRQHGLSSPVDRLSDRHRQF